MTSETQFFYSLQPDRVLDAVEASGFRCTGRTFPLNSMENRVYEIELDVPPETIKSPSERFIVAKFYRPGRWSREQLLEEHEFLLDCARHDVEVVAPILDENGESLREMKEGIFYAVFRKQGGRIEQELGDEDLARMGRLIGRLHNIGGIREAEHRLRIGVETYGTGNIQFLRESGIIPPDYEPHYIRYAEMICEHSVPLFEGLNVQRIHGDCHAGNVLWGSNGPALVDFDDMLTGPPVQDIWLLIPGRDADSRQKLEMLLEGYEQMRPFDRRTLRLIEPLRALRIIHFASWIARRWDDPAFKAFFPHFGTDQYWREQVEILSQQWDQVRQPVWSGGIY